MQKRKRKEAQGTKSQEGRESILKLVPSAFSIGAAFWLWKKKGTLMILFWLASFFKSNLWNHSSREQIRPSPTEIHRLHKNLEELPKLQFQSQTQELVETKSEPTPFDERLAKKEEKIESLEERIGELNLEATKHNLTIDSYQKDAKESAKCKEIARKNKPERNRHFAIQGFYFAESGRAQEFSEKARNHKIRTSIDKKLFARKKRAMQSTRIQIFQSNQELVEARQEIKGLIDKLQASERRGKGQRIFYALDLIFNSRIFRRI